MNLVFDGPGYHKFSVYGEKKTSDLILTAFITDSVFVPEAPVVNDEIVFSSQKMYRITINPDSVIFVFQSNPTSYKVDLSFVNTGHQPGNTCDWQIEPWNSGWQFNYYDCDSIAFEVDANAYNNNTFTIKKLEINECGFAETTASFVLGKEVLQSIGENQGELLKFYFYPNPFKKDIFLEMTGQDHSDKKFTITDIKGIEIYTEVIPGSFFPVIHQIDLSGFEPGIYLGSIMNSKIYIVFNLIKY